MHKATATALKSDGRTIEATVWGDWLTQAAVLASKFSAVEDDPFAYNETASVSLLTAAATSVGMLALAEYVSIKRHRRDRRYNARGRCDLWISDQTRSWAFEFKQKFYEGGRHSVTTIQSWLDDAWGDARSLNRSEGQR